MYDRKSARLRTKTGTLLLCCGNERKACRTGLLLEREHLVFILWGNYARTKGAHIDRSKHLVLESAHPSPFSAANGFFGSKPFSKANDYLEMSGVTPIDWQ